MSKDQQLETIFLSTDDRPLEGWSKFVKNGYVKRVTDDEVIGGVLELHGGPEGVHLAKPEAAGESLSVSKRWLTILFKPIRQDPFKFQVQCLDSSGVKRVFRFDTRKNNPKVQYCFADIPFSYKPTWNNLDVDLRLLMRKCYGTDLSEVTRVQVHGACRLRRLSFSDVFFTDDNLPNDLKLISSIKPHLTKSNISSENQQSKISE